MGDDDKGYSCHTVTGKQTRLKVKVCGKCFVPKVKTHGHVTVYRDRKCPFDSFYTHCETFKKGIKGITDGFAALEQLHSVWTFIFSVGKRAGLPTEMQRQWDDAVGGWGREFDKKTRKMAEQRKVLSQNLDKYCRDFYNNKIVPLIDHALDPKTPARLDGSRRHDAQLCNEYLSMIPSPFWHSTTGRELGLAIARLYHKDTYSKDKNSRLAIFLASSKKTASAADLLDSTVFESGLINLNYILPALTIDHKFTMNARGFLDYLKGKELIRVRTNFEKLGAIPRKDVKDVIWIKGGDVKFKVQTLKLENKLSSVALANILNTVALLSAIEDLSTNKTLYNKMKTTKAIAEVVASISKLGQLRIARLSSRTAGVIGLGLEGLLSSYDGARQLNLSHSRDDRTLLAAAHFVKAIGCGLMIVSLPVGAAIYLIGSLGVSGLDRDPFIEWAKYTAFGADKYRDKQYASSRLALFQLDRLLKA